MADTVANSQASSASSDDGIGVGDLATVASWISAILLAVFLVLAEHRVPRTRGRIWKYHAIFAIVGICIVLLTPEKFRLSLFSSLGVAVVGTVFPIYESIRAVCTITGEDDKAWVQYWISQSALVFASEFFFDIVKENDNTRTYVYEFLFLLYLWLLLPFTDGASVIFDYITVPLFGSFIKRAHEKTSKMVNNVIQFTVNASHLYILYVVFIFLPAWLKRFVTLSVGIIYPFLSSVVAVTTITYDDDTFWLTYWSCYGILFLIMKILETWFGWIPGFYTIFLLSTVYLMVPMFNGAEKVFRNFLVPLVGLQELLYIRDALKVKKEILESLPPDRVAVVKAAIAKSFAMDENDDDDDGNNNEEGGAKEEDPLINFKYGSIHTV